MKRKSTTAYQYANRLAAQQLKPLRELVERTTAVTSGKSGQRNNAASQAARKAEGALSN